MLGEILSIGGDLLGGFLNNEAAEDRQNSAQAFSAQQFATRYQTTVKDLKAAGLNPMLAYSQGGGNAPTSSAASSSGYSGSIGSNAVQAGLATKMNSAQVANIQADTANKQAQADLIQAQIGQTNASAGQANAQVGLINANAQKVFEEIKNIPTEGARLRQMVQMLSQQSTLMAQQGMSEQERQGVLRATASKLQSEKTLLDFDISAISKFDNFGKEYQQYKPIIDLLKSIFQPRGGGITINK
jgi:hypothetical protein